MLDAVPTSRTSYGQPFCLYTHVNAGGFALVGLKVREGGVEGKGWNRIYRH